MKNDIIRRQDAIDAIDDTDWYHQNKNGEMVSGANPSYHQAWYKEEDIYNVLESLPSAEPEIIRCKDCENWDTSWKPTTSSGKSHYCALKDGVWEPDDYCSYAERRGDSDE